LFLFYGSRKTKNGAIFEENERIQEVFPMEIERKFLIRQLPDHLESYAHHQIEQGYLCSDPVVRVRKEDSAYYMTYKGKGKMVREEYNLPLNAEAYAHLIEKADGYRITKTRYLIPLDGENEGLTAELDIFTAPGELVMVEVEFASEAQALSFQAPDWFGPDVTQNKAYHNSYMSRHGIIK
jgi:CYTH domain-containing protein